MSKSPSQRVVGFSATPDTESSCDTAFRSLGLSDSETMRRVDSTETGMGNEPAGSDDDVFSKLELPSLSPRSSISLAASPDALTYARPVSLLHCELKRASSDGPPAPQRGAVSSDAALNLLRGVANKVISAEKKVSCSEHSQPQRGQGADEPQVGTEPSPLERSSSSPSTPISIPIRNTSLHAAAARSRSETDTGRVLRRVPEPPIRPTAVTAPAVVQLLLAAQAAAAAERLRQELAYHCDRNNMKRAYVCQEKRRVLEAHAQRLEAEGAQLPDDPTSPVALRRTASEAGFQSKVDWEGWYDLPHGNIAAAEYCAGEAEKAFARGLM